MPFAITLLAALLFQSIDDITGAWRGSVMHEGETREVIVEFVRTGDRVATLTTTLPPEMVPVAVARGLVFAGGLDGVLYAFER